MFVEQQCDGVCPRCIAVMHLVVHRSAKISVTYLHQGRMEVTITSGMTKEELVSQMRGKTRPCGSASHFGKPSRMPDDGTMPVADVDDAHDGGPPPVSAPRRTLASRTSSQMNMLLLAEEVDSMLSATSGVVNPIFYSEKKGRNSSSVRHMISPLASINANTNGMGPIAMGQALMPKQRTPPSNDSSLSQSIDQARMGLARGCAPMLAPSGTGGTYFMCDPDGSKVAVFKPEDEEPLAMNNPRGMLPSATGEGLRKGTRVGEGALREVAAYLLDHDHFAGVPATCLAHLCGSHVLQAGETAEDVRPKRGSLQQYVASSSDCEEMGTTKFDIEEVHKITVLDLRLANADRNGGNILVREKFPEDGCDAPTEKQYELIPIDHGYTLPHTLQDVSFEWEFWHQAEVPYSASTRAYIAKLDAENDLATLAAAGISLPAECARNLRVCTMLLKKGAEAGLSPAVIAGVMTRQLENKRSHLEKMTTLARNRAFGRGEKSLDKLEVWSDEEEVIYMKTFEKLLDEYLENIQEEHLLDGIS